MERVIITGATGEIGLALVSELLCNGNKITVIMRPNSKRINRLPKHRNLQIIEIELENLSMLFLERKPQETYDVFYHLGWDYSRDHNNVSQHFKNIDYTLNAIELAVELGCECFIGAGSQAEYGSVKGIISENTETRPETAYGIAKLCAGQMGKLLCEQKGIRFVWPRIFSVYGPGDAESTMVISTIRALLLGKCPLLTEGTQLWDFLFSKDAAYALRLLGEKRGCKGIYCIAQGEARALKEYIKEIRDAIDPLLPLAFGGIPYKNNKTVNLEVNIEKLRIDTGFYPKVSFKEGIKETIAWIKEHPQIIETGYGS